MGSEHRCLALHACANPGPAVAPKIGAGPVYLTCHDEQHRGLDKTRGARIRPPLLPRRGEQVQRGVEGGLVPAAGRARDGDARAAADYAAAALKPATTAGWRMSRGRDLSRAPWRLGRPRPLARRRGRLGGSGHGEGHRRRRRGRLARRSHVCRRRPVRPVGEHEGEGEVAPAQRSTRGGGAARVAHHSCSRNHHYERAQGVSGGLHGVAGVRRGCAHVEAAAMANGASVGSESWSGRSRPSDQREALRKVQPH